MGAGLGSFGGGKVRHWGPIEIGWTLVVIVGLAAGAWLAVLGADVADHWARHYTYHDPVFAYTEGSSAWRPLVFGGIHMEIPADLSRPDAKQLARVPFPVDARILDFDQGAAVIAEVSAPPPSNGAEAQAYAQAVLRLLQPTPVLIWPEPRNGDATLRGTEFGGEPYRGTPGDWEAWNYDVYVVRGRTYVLIGHQQYVGSWIPHMFGSVGPVA